MTEGRLGRSRNLGWPLSLFARLRAVRGCGFEAGFHDDGPYLRCLHSTCTETQEINRRLKLAYASKIPVHSGNGVVKGAATVETAAPMNHALAAVPVNQEALDSLLATYPRTDTGNAERLVARFGHALRFCHPWSKWLVWDWLRWKIDDTAAVKAMVKRTVRAMYREAALLLDADDAEEHAKHKAASENEGPSQRDGGPGDI